MKTILCLSFACLIAVVAVAEPRTWTFTEKGKIKFQSGGMRFAKGARIHAEFVRADTTHAFLKIINAGGVQDGCVPLASLSEADLLYVEKVKAAPVNVARVEPDAQAREAKNPQDAQVVAKETAKSQAQEGASARHYGVFVKATQDLREVKAEAGFQAWFDKHWDHLAPAEQTRLSAQWLEQLKSEAALQSRLAVSAQSKN
jgi:hypothetical protein